MEMPFVRSFALSKVAKLDIALAPSSEISRESEGEDERRCSGKRESELGAVVKGELEVQWFSMVSILIAVE